MQMYCRLTANKGRKQGWFDPGTASEESQAEEDLDVGRSWRKRGISFGRQGYLIQTCSWETVLSEDKCLKLKVWYMNIWKGR